ncbi:MAG: hypothetical protein JWN29_4118 [Acidimicrobiales bacterium]|nr:hypothetical protein [Acidimicrobiales bacterium]
MSGPVDDPPPVARGPVEDRRHSLFHRHHDEDEQPAAWCPQCGGEFRAGTTWCDDCGVPLSTEKAREPDPETETAAAVEARRDVVEYDLSDWSQEQARELNDQLAIDHVPHQWTMRTLRIAGEFEARADALIDAIDGLDDVPDDVQYEFQDWTPQQCEQLVTRLVELGIACVWDGYLLGIGAADEAAVDAEVLTIDPDFPITPTDEGEA